MSIASAISKCIGLLIVVLLATSRAQTTQPSSHDGLKTAPMAYFEQSCARCHGDYGANYGNQFGKNLSDAQLAKAVDDMCSGPGNAPLSGADLQAEIAFHRSLVDGKPFICVTETHDSGLSGETTDGATVAVDGHPAKVDGATWTSDATVKTANTISAKLGDQTTTIEWPTTYSHSQPTTAPAGK